MANNKVLIDLLVNPKTAKAGLKEFESYLNKLQSSAASGNGKVAQLPREAKARLLDTKQVVNGKDTAELKKQEQLLKRMAQERGKLLGLAQAELAVAAKAGGKTASSVEVGKLGKVSSSAFAKSLGLDTLPTEIQKEFDRVARQTRQAINKATGQLSGAAAQNQFRTLANQTLADVGVVAPTRVRDAKRVVQSTTPRRVEPTVVERPVLERPPKVRPRVVDSSVSDERAKKASESNAKDAERSAASQKTSRAKSDKALSQKAATDEKAAQLKFTRETVEVNGVKRNTGDLIARTGPGAKDRYQVAKSPGNDGYNLTYPGRSNPDDVFATQREAKAAAQRHLAATNEQAILAEAQVVNEAESLANQETNQAAQKAAEARTTKAKTQEASTAEKAAQLKFSRDAGGQFPSYSAIAPSGNGYIINKGADKRYEVYDDQAGEFRKEKYDKLGDAKEAVQRLENSRVAALQETVVATQAEAALTQASTAQQKAEDARQLAAEKQITQATAKQAVEAAKSSVRRVPGDSQPVVVTQRPVKVRPTPAVVDTDTPEKPKRTRRTAEERIAQGERDLIDSLTRKKKALNAQARVLEQKLGQFTSAEKELIDALKRKAKALDVQTKAVQKLTPQPVGPKPSNTQKPKSQAGSSGGAGSGNSGLPYDLSGFDPEDGFNAVAAAQARVNSAYIEQATLLELFNQNLAGELAEYMAIINAMNARLRGSAMMNIADDPNGLGEDYSRGRAEERVARTELSALTEEQLADPALAARLIEAELRLLAATNEQGAARAREVLKSPQLLQSEVELIIINQKVAAARARLLNSAAYRDDVISGRADTREQQILLDTDVRGAVNSRPEVTQARARQRVDNSTSRARVEQAVANDPALASEELAAAVKLHLLRVQNSSAKWLEISSYSSVIAKDAAEEKIARDKLTKAINDEYFQRRAAAEGLTPDAATGRGLTGVEKLEEKAATTEAIANDDTLEARYVKSQVRLIEANNRLAAKVETLAASSPEILNARLEKLQRDRRAKIDLEEAYLSTDQGQADVRRQAALRQQRRQIAGTTRETPFAQAKSNPGQFFGQGALSAVRYGLPSMLLYGAGSGLMNTVREAEQLQVALAKLESQFEATFGGDRTKDFADVRQGILNVAQDTGLAADEIANLQIQLTGAFAGSRDTEGRTVNIGGKSGLDLVESQVASAAKLAQTVGLPLAEITDGLTAASLAFDASFEQIGDVALSIEQQSGVLAKETISFIGDIAPVAKEAGYELEEFAAIAAVAQQRSGRSGTALAESFGRVIPAITEQKDKLLELASLDPTLATDSFVDAIRDSDPKAILDEIGRSYNNLNKEAQQTVVTLLGGRREAQALIPALANQELTKRLQETAENSAGTLEERFQKIRQTISNTLQRVTELVRQVGVELLEAGLADAFLGALSAAKLFLNILSPIAKIIGTINDAFGGLPIQILAGVAALKLMQALLTKTAADGTRSVVGGAITNSVFGPQGFLQNATAGYAGGFRQNFRQGVISGGSLPANLTNGLSTRTLIASNGLFGGAKAAGAGALSAIGGGSIALGAGFVGITALAALYGKVNSERDKAEAELKELREEIERGNQDLDLEDVDIRNRRVEDLRAQVTAEQARVERWYEGWNGFLTSLNVVQSRAEVLATQATVLENFDPKVSEFFEYADQTVLQATSDLVAPTLGRGTRKFRDSLSKYDVNGTDPTMPNGFEVGSDGKIRNASARFNPFLPANYRADEQRFIEESARLAGVEVPELDPRLVALLADPAGNPAELINEAANAQGEYAEYGEKFAEQAAAIRESFANAGYDDKEINAAIEALVGSSDLSDIEQNDLDLQQLQTAFNVGQLSLDEYLKRSREKLEARRAILSAGENPASELEILQVAQQEAEVNKQASEAILAQQERLNSIKEALGQDTTGDATVVQTNTELLANPNFQDGDARLQAALAIVEAQKNIDIETAQATGDINEVLRVLNQGSNVPPVALATINLGQLEETQAFKDARTSLVKTFRKLFSTDINESDIDAFYEKIFADVFDDGALNPTNIQNLQSRITSILGQINAASFDELSDQEQQDLLSSFDSLIALLAFGGVTRDKLIALLRSQEGNSGKTDKELEDLLNGILASNPLGDPEAIAKANRQRGVQAIADTYTPKITAAENNSVELAKIAKQQADAELQYLIANGGSAKEINEAKQKQVQAENALNSAYAEAQSAKMDYYATIARINGDLVGAAQLELQGINAQLQAAYAAQDWVAVNNLLGQQAQKQDDIRKQQVADANSFINLSAGLAELNGDAVGAARLRVQEAVNTLNAARTIEDRNAGALALAQAQDALRRAEIDAKNRDFDLWAGVLDFMGDIEGAALTRLRQAQYRLSVAKPGQETTDAQLGVLQAETAYRQAQGQIRDVFFGQFAAATNDPVKDAQIELARAKEQLRMAKGAAEEGQARIAVLNAQKALGDAMNDARYAMFNLRQAELNAMGDEVGAAQVAAELARQQLNDAIKAGAGTAAIANSRANWIAADKAAKDAVFNDRMEEYKWLLDMGKISKSQYINYLEGLKSTLIPGTKQFKDLELTIKQLKNDIGSDLQANLPTSLKLPTLYEVRRFNQTGADSGGATSAGGIGYQDNRQVSVNVEINNATEDTQTVVLNTMKDVLGVGRNGYGERRY